MTDLEITRRCAEKMGFAWCETGEDWDRLVRGPKKMAVANQYDPLHDDAQAMALLKKFHILLHCDLVNTSHVDEEWLWGVVSQDHTFGTESFDLNRAICECVAKIEAAPTVEGTTKSFTLFSRYCFCIF